MNMPLHWTRQRSQVQTSLATKIQAGLFKDEIDKNEILLRINLLRQLLDHTEKFLDGLPVAIELSKHAGGKTTKQCNSK
jgi:hypothetical protein